MSDIDYVFEFDTPLGAKQAEALALSQGRELSYVEQRAIVYASMRNYVQLPLLSARVCDQVDPDLFFPEKGGTPKHAIELCKTCPEQAPCRDFAVENDIKYGVWGGTTEKERRMLRKLLDG